MEDKIEVGEYIRTKRGYIRQVVRRDVDGHILLDVGFEGASYLTKVEEKEVIVKRSKKLVNLIERYDFCNDRLVIDVDRKNEMVCLLEPFDEKNPSNSCMVWHSIKDIESIVTKEQFNSRKYEIK